MVASIRAINPKPIIRIAKSLEDKRAPGLGGRPSKNLYTVKPKPIIDVAVRIHAIRVRSCAIHVRSAPNCLLVGDVSVCAIRSPMLMVGNIRFSVMRQAAHEAGVSGEARVPLP